MFTYYKKVVTEEEMLFTSEIARMYNIFKVNNRTNEVSKSAYADLVSMIIDEYIEDNKILKEEIYYPTKSGIDKVYPKSIYEPAMKQFLEIYKEFNEVQIHYYNGRAQKFVWFKDQSNKTYYVKYGCNQS